MHVTIRSIRRGALALASCFRFAAWHHPPWEPPGSQFSPGLRRNIVPLVERNGVQVVFEGHLHAYARSRPHKGVLYVAVGTGGAELEYDAGELTIPSARVVQGHYGALRVDVTTVLPLDRSAEGLATIAGGQARGKIVITVD